MVNLNALRIVTKSLRTTEKDPVMAQLLDECAHEIERLREQVRAPESNYSPRYYVAMINAVPDLYLLALERTGWRRYVYGRWVYNSEPFRRDLQRAFARVKSPKSHCCYERYYPPEDQ